MPITPEAVSYTHLIPEEMRAVAASLGVAYLRDSSREALLARLPELRQKHGDRAVLRAMHFFADDQRVAEEVESLERQDFEAFKRLVDVYKRQP